MGDNETPEVYHTAQQRLKVHSRQSHIQANKAFYVPSLIRGFYGKTLTIIVGEDGKVRGGNVGN